MSLWDNEQFTIKCCIMKPIHKLEISEAFKVAPSNESYPKNSVVWIREVIARENYAGGASSTVLCAGLPNAT